MNSGKRTILVVDDAPENIDIVHHALGENYRVLAATSAAEAIEIIKDGQVPELVLTDINMPQISGFQLCEFVRGHQSTRSAPVIFMSGSMSNEETQRGREVGGNDFLQKPISIKTLRQLVQGYAKESP